LYREPPTKDSVFAKPVIARAKVVIPGAKAAIVFVKTVIVRVKPAIARAKAVIAYANPARGLLAKDGELMTREGKPLAINNVSSTKREKSAIM
jgi:hypothetical protein